MPTPAQVAIFEDELDNMLRASQRADESTATSQTRELPGRNFSDEQFLNVPQGVPAPRPPVQGPEPGIDIEKLYNLSGMRELPEIDDPVLERMRQDMFKKLPGYPETQTMLERLPYNTNVYDIKGNVWQELIKQQDEMDGYRRGKPSDSMLETYAELSKTVLEARVAQLKEQVNAMKHISDLYSGSEERRLKGKIHADTFGLSRDKLEAKKHSDFIDDKLALFGAQTDRMKVENEKQALSDKKKEEAKTVNGLVAKVREFLGDGYTHADMAAFMISDVSDQPMEVRELWQRLNKLPKQMLNQVSMSGQMTQSEISDYFAAQRQERKEEIQAKIHGLVQAYSEEFEAIRNDSRLEPFAKGEAYRALDLKYISSLKPDEVSAFKQALFQGR
jgi:hypothetical protein